MCITSKHSENTCAASQSFIQYFNITQTLTSLTLSGNLVRDEGARYLGTALQVNTVRIFQSISVTHSSLSLHTDTCSTKSLQQQD